MKIHIVSATRQTKEAFWASSALGLSLRRFADDKRLVPWIAYENTQGLPDIYNQVIDPKVPAGPVVFIHDDVWLDDNFFADRIVEGLKRFDVIGIAGNKRRVDHQPSWAFINKQFQWDNKENLSGTVAHGQAAFGKLTVFGDTPAECELLDGIMIAAHTDTLIKRDCRFDPRFKFHFYDLDFCRTARDKGMTLGTWPIGVTHQSGGAFGTESWWKGYEGYMGKWGS